MVEMPPTNIFLRHGEVPICVVLLFRRGSSSASLPYENSSLEPPIIFLDLFSSY
jgi:hypothetical protein